jgi:hypothetical protein
MPGGWGPRAQGPSPDEVALVEGARKLGFEFLARTRTHISLRMQGHAVRGPTPAGPSRAHRPSPTSRAAAAGARLQAAAAPCPAGARAACQARPLEQRTQSLAGPAARAGRRAHSAKAVTVDARTATPVAAFASEGRHRG